MHTTETYIHGFTQPYNRVYSIFYLILISVMLNGEGDFCYLKITRSQMKPLFLVRALKPNEVGLHGLLEI